MLPQVAGLLIGIVLMALHRPFADFIMELEHASAAIFRTAGVNMPAPPRRSVMHTIYFCLGMFVWVFSMAKLYAALPH